MDQELIKVLKRLGAQLVTQQAMLVKMEKTLRGLAMTPQGAVRIVPFGVKDITTAQLVDAYHRGMNLEQLTALANGKYTPEQIKIKIIKAGGV